MGFEPRTLEMSVLCYKLTFSRHLHTTFWLFGHLQEDSLSRPNIFVNFNFNERLKKCGYKDDRYIYKNRILTMRAQRGWGTSTCEYSVVFI